MDLRPSFPRGYQRIAVVYFYLFLILGVFVPSVDPDNGRTLSRAAMLGVTYSAIMWWVVDAIDRKREVPLISLVSIGYAMPLYFPSYYFATRGRAGTRRFLKHVFLSFFAIIIAAIAGGICSHRYDEGSDAVEITEPVGR